MPPDKELLRGKRQERNCKRDRQGAGKRKNENDFVLDLKVDPSKWVAQVGIPDVPIFDNYGNPSSDWNVINGLNIGEPELPDLETIAEMKYMEQTPYDKNNSCDEFVYDILKRANRNPELYCLGNTKETVAEHIEELKKHMGNFSTPEIGCNIVFMGDGNDTKTIGHEHCGILFLKPDGKIIYYDSSKNNKGENPVRETYKTLKDFLRMYHLYDSFYYQFVL